MLPAVATLPSSLWYLISLTAQHSVHISLPFLLFVQWVVNGSGPISKEPSFPNNKTNVRWSKPMNVLLEYSLFSFNIVWEETSILICSPDDCVIHCWNRSNQFLCIELDDYNFQIDMINFSLSLALSPTAAWIRDREPIDSGFHFCLIIYSVCTKDRIKALRAQSSKFRIDENHSVLDWNLNI